MPTELSSRPAPGAVPPPGAGRPLTGRFVLVAVVAFFAVIAAANAVLVKFALSSFGGVEVESAYKAGLAFSGDVADAEAQADRGWKVAMTLPRSGEPRFAVVDVRDAEGSPLAALEATVTFEHPADRRLDVTVALEEREPGRYVASLPDAHGQRIARLRIGRDGADLFRSENRVMLP